MTSRDQRPSCSTTMSVHRYAQPGISMRSENALSQA